MLKHQGKLDQVFFALADPTRRAIVERLSRREATVSELAKPFRMSLPAVHQHLAVLREAGLVTSIKQGRTRTCQLDAAALAGAEDWVRSRRQGWLRRLDKLERYLQQDQEPKK